MSRSHRRRPSGLTKALLLLGFVLVVLWASAALANLRSARAEAARSSERLVALVGDIDLQAVVGGADVPGLRSAAEDLRVTRDRLRSPLLRPARPLPVVGRQLRSAERLLDATARLADATADAEVRAGAAAVMLRTPGSSRVEALQRLAVTIRDLERVVGSVDLGPRDGLAGPLDEARTRVAATTATAAERLGSAAESLEMARGVLAGPARYLLLVANNAEMRSGSGAYLSLGVLSASGGQLQLQAPEKAGSFKVPPGIVEPEKDVADRWGWRRPTVQFQGLMLSPRFDASAPSAARMWELAGQAPVDGVLAVDVGALATLLRAVGPVRLEGIEVTTDSAQEELLHGQYVRFPDQSARQDSLQALTVELFSKLTTGRVDLPALADGLGRAVRGRHLMAWSGRPADQALWDRTGAHGRLTAQSLLVSSVNLGSNKLDPHLEVEAALTNVQAPDVDATDHELRITLTNNSLLGDPGYVAGPNIDGLQEGEYLGVLSVNLPAFADQPAVDGAPQPTVDGTDGPGRVLGVQYQLLRGDTRVVVVRFRTRGSEGWLRLEPSSRLPGVRWTVEGRSPLDDQPTVIRWPGAPPEGAGP